MSSTTNDNAPLIGDILDPANRHRAAAPGAIGFVLVATLLDVVTAPLYGGGNARPKPLSPELPECA